MRYYVSASIREPNGADRPTQFGPFETRGEAERCVTALAARSDVTSATIET